MLAIFVFASVVCICATFVWFAKNYIQPYTPTKPEELPEVTETPEVTFDNIIAEIYDRLGE